MSEDDEHTVCTTANADPSRHTGFDRVDQLRGTASEVPVDDLDDELAMMINEVLGDDRTRGTVISDGPSQEGCTTDGLDLPEDVLREPTEVLLAVGMIAGRHGLDCATAFDHLHGYAIRTGRQLLPVAHDVIARSITIP